MMMILTPAMMITITKKIVFVSDLYRRQSKPKLSKAANNLKMIMMIMKMLMMRNEMIIVMPAMIVFVCNLYRLQSKPKLS